MADDTAESDTDTLILIVIQLDKSIMAYTSPRKQARGRRHLPDVPLDSPCLKAVSFSDDVVETSIGGTHTVAKIKMKGEPLVPVSDSRNMDTRSGASLQCQSANFTSAKSLTQASQPRVAKAQESGEQTENKENVEEAKISKNKTSQLKPSNDQEDVFISPIGRPAKAAALTLVKEFEKFTLLTKPDSVRRTTQEYLDQIPDAFLTPPQPQMRRHTLETKVFQTPDCYRIVQMETPRKSSFDMMPGTDDSLTEAESGDGEDSCSIMVAVRVRPYSQR